MDGDNLQYIRKNGNPTITSQPGFWTVIMKCLWNTRAEIGANQSQTLPAPAMSYRSACSIANGRQGSSFKPGSKCPSQHAVVARPILVLTCSNIFQCSFLYFLLTCLYIHVYASHPMSSIWTPRTDKTWVQFPTRRDVYTSLFFPLY